MDILQMLSMARSNNGNMFPVYEAEGDKTDIDVANEDTDATDYTEDVDDDTPDYTEDVEEAGDGEPEEDTDTEEEPVDDDTEDEATDYTEDVETDEVTDDDGADNAEDETASDEETQEEQTPEDASEQAKKAALLDDFITLHTIIKNNIEKLNTSTETDMTVNKIIIQVKKNLTVLQDSLFTLIIRTYSLNTYVKNLYLYNYFTQSLAINLEMLSKISVFITNPQNKYIKNN